MRFFIKLKSKEVMNLFEDGIIGIYETEKELSKWEILLDYIDYVSSLDDDFIVLKSIIVKWILRKDEFDVILDI